jgi:periplasmic divalent cation tolerance protein
MSESEFVFVYSTFPDEAAARRVGEALVTARLAACVNIYPPMHSIYEWQGKLESGPEVVAFIKTRRANVDNVIAAARPLHPYATPCFPRPAD